MKPVGETLRQRFSLASGWLRWSSQNVLNVFENVASVKIVAGTWIDYLHVGRVDGEWKIINVLWEMKPQSE